MGDHGESSTAVGILRNDDPLSQALRNGPVLEIDDYARINRAMSPAHAALSSIGTLSTAVFTSREASTTTKPTSTGTSHPTNARNDKGKRKCKSGYSSSLSGTNGSASEAEVGRRALRRENLLAMGDWAEPSRTLKGSVRARERPQTRRYPKPKKHAVVIEQGSPAHGRSDKDIRPAVADAPLSTHVPVATTTPSRNRTGQRYLRHRLCNHDDDPVQLAEQGQAQPMPAPEMRLKPLSPIRVYVLGGVIALMVLTVALASYSAYLTGKSRMSCTKGIVFAATASLAFLTVLALLVARRALSEALLAGLLEFVFGFALLVELDDFM